MKYNRYLPGSLNSPGASGRARLVLGARQTGKSTVFSMLKNGGDLLIDLQDRSERLRFANNPGLLTRTAAALKQPSPHILIDEIQRVPELLYEIQFILDKNPGKFTFTLTGSSARKLKRGAANLLPGRARLYHIFPVSLAEQERHSKDFVLETPREIIPIEVKYTANISPRDAAGVEKFINLYPKAKRGFVVLLVKREEKLTGRVSAIPWHEI